MNPGAARAGILALAIAGLALSSRAQSGPADGWRTFEGSWSAMGERQTLPTGGQRPASIAHLSGSVTLTLGEGLSRGFRGELIGFDDGASLRAGRCVWTDEKGNLIFSELKGEPFQTGRRMEGAFTGGTGRYAGIEGAYTFEWQFVLTEEGGAIQGQAVKLKGRFRPGAPR